MNRKQSKQEDKEFRAGRKIDKKAKGYAKPTPFYGHGFKFKGVKDVQNIDENAP